MFNIKTKLNVIGILLNLVLFFFLFCGFAFAAAPTTGTIIPSSGSSTPDIAKTFTCTYADLDGWVNIKEAYLLINPNSTVFTNTCYLYYDQNTNLLFLRDDANTSWLGGFSPASSNIIENSFVKLNCSATTVSGTVNTLTVNFNLTFKASFSGKAYNTYLKAVDDTNAYANWARKGAFTVNYAPSIGAVSPVSGTGTVETAATFITAYADLDGWQNIQYVYFLINSSISGANCFYGYYNQNTNKLYLRNDANTAWLGGYSPGSANTIENSFAKLNCANTSISGNGANMTVTWSLVLKTPFTGAKNTYSYVRDDVNAYGNYTKVGTWSIPNQSPATGTVTPSSGQSQPDQIVNFASTYFDPDTWLNIQYVYFLINTTSGGTNCFYGYYNRDTNKLYLRNDANTAWIGGYAPGSNYIIENSYAKLSCISTVVSGLGNTLSVNWAVTFKPVFLGIKNIYLYVRDYANAYKNWTQAGIWAIQADVIPPTGTIKINNDAQYTNSNSVTLTLSAQDNPGGSGISQMQFSNDNVTWSTPENYALAKSWGLTSADEVKTVYVKYKDIAGNWSETYSATIILDTTPPVILINPVNTPTNQDVTLVYTVTDNFTPLNQIVITGDNSPYINEGAQNVILNAVDLAGNGASNSVSFTIDKTPPVIIISSPNDGTVVENQQIQLEGTIDGAAFSETRDLSVEGQNVLTKTAVDSAGNSSSVSINVYLYLGQLIGPAGGEVLSSDGKVKIIVPSGALNDSQQIKVLTVNKEALQNAAPSNSSLLSVVECKPYGLVFNKPVSIIYTLNQAEIPGTPVELGLYDSVQDKIISAGQVSTVPSDGYTINFSIMHFSTYAALKSLISQGAPIGAGVKIPLPDMLTGAFGHAIPITVPPGRKGMQPGLALSYRSSNPNSWVGLGYSLNPGYIVRSTRLGPPSYIDVNDTFYFISDSGTTELVHLIDNLYQAKVESAFNKFFKDSDDSWRVVGKDGSVLRFGQSVDSKEISSSGTFSWYLTKVSDLNGNYIGYSYIKDQGKPYLSRIDYTGNEIGISPANSVEFFLEARNDIASSYISSARIATAKRLKEIQVKTGYDMVWRYVLEYAYSPDTNRSLLKSITQFGSDGKSLPTQTFTYQQAK